MKHIQYCDDCGDKLIGKDFYPITHLEIDIDSANKGESGILCPACYDKYLKGVDKEWDKGYTSFFH